MMSFQSPARGVRRGAFTLVEVAVAGALLAVVLLGVQHVVHVAMRGTSRATDVEAQLRGMSIGLETIGRDVRLFAPKSLKTDLWIGRDGRSFGLRVPRSIDGDLWSMDLEAVSYQLVALPGDRQQLVRRDSTGTHPIGSCVVGDMRVQYVPAGKLGARTGYLQITFVGPIQSGSQPLVASDLWPVRRVVEPHTFSTPEVHS